MSIVTRDTLVTQKASELLVATEWQDLIVRDGDFTRRISATAAGALLGIDALDTRVDGLETDIARTLRATTAQPPLTPVADHVVGFDGAGLATLISIPDLTTGPPGPPGEWSILNNRAHYYYTGDGTAGALTLPVSVPSNVQVAFYIDGVRQSQDDFTASGTTLTPSFAIPLGAKVHVEITRPETLSNIEAANVETTSGLSAQAEIDRRGIVYASRADAIAATVPAPVQVITVMHPGGIALSYAADADGTALATNSGARWWSPADIITPMHWQENTVPGATDMRAAWQGAIDYASTRGGGVVDGLGRTYGIGATVNMIGRPDVFLENFEMTAVGSWLPETEMIRFNRGGTESLVPCGIHRARIRCAGLANGILVTDINGVRLTNVRIQGFPAFGVRSRVKAGELFMHQVDCRQFIWGETGFNVQANRTGIGFDMDTADFIMQSCISAYCAIPVKTRTRGPAQLTNCHFYNGALDPLTVTEQPLSADFGSPTLICTGNYFDNGLVRVQVDVGWTTGDGETAGAAPMMLNDNHFHRNGNGSNASLLEFVNEAAEPATLRGIIMSGNTFSSSGGVIFTGAFAPDVDRLWITMNNARPNGDAVPGLPTLSLRGRVFIGPSAAFGARLVTLTNNTAAQVDMGKHGGHLMMTAGGGPGFVQTQANFSAQLFVNLTATGPSAVITSAGIGADVEIGSGVPTGTTGTVGRVGIYPQDDGTLYIENRSGGTRSLYLVMM